MSPKAEKLELDIRRMDYDDYDEFEQLIGIDFDDAFKLHVVRDEETGEILYETSIEDGHEVKRPLREPKVSRKVMRAITYLVLKHDDPSMTFEKAGHISPAEYEIIFDDPKPSNDGSSD